MTMVTLCETDASILCTILVMLLHVQIKITSKKKKIQNKILNIRRKENANLNHNESTLQSCCNAFNFKDELAKCR